MDRPAPRIGPTTPRRPPAMTEPMADRLIQGIASRPAEPSPAGSVDLAFADPPFSIGYGDVYHDRRRPASTWH